MATKKWKLFEDVDLLSYFFSRVWWHSNFFVVFRNCFRGLTNRLSEHIEWTKLKTSTTFHLVQDIFVENQRKKTRTKVAADQNAAPSGPAFFHHWEETARLYREICSHNRQLKS